MVKGLASFWYWDLLRNGIERKNFGLDESWYIALLGQYTHFLVHLYYFDNDSHSRFPRENDNDSHSQRPPGNDYDSHSH